MLPESRVVSNGKRRVAAFMRLAAATAGLESDLLARGRTAEKPVPKRQPVQRRSLLAALIDDKHDRPFGEWSTPFPQSGPTQVRKVLSLVQGGELTAEGRAARLAWPTSELEKALPATDQCIRIP